MVGRVSLTAVPLSDTPTLCEEKMTDTAACRLGARFLLLCMLLALSGCANIAKNFDPDDQLGDRKLMAGRILFFEEKDRVDCDEFDYQIYFKNRRGGKMWTLRPDEECYVYVPVEAGRYGLAQVTHSSWFTGSFKFALDPVPTVDVRTDDTVVNFCTIEVHFHQGTGSKMGVFWLGHGRAWIRVVPAEQCEETEAALRDRLGGSSTPVRNGGVNRESGTRRPVF
jgi:hypothetical protein